MPAHQHGAAVDCQVCGRTNVCPGCGQPAGQMLDGAWQATNGSGTIPQPERIEPDYVLQARQAHADAVAAFQPYQEAWHSAVRGRTATETKHDGSDRSARKIRAAIDAERQVEDARDLAWRSVVAANDHVRNMTQRFVIEMARAS
jgi:hypothetical protein